MTSASVALPEGKASQTQQNDQTRPPRQNRDASMLLPECFHTTKTGLAMGFPRVGLFRSQTLDGQAAAATHERNDKMPGCNGEFDSSVADETATAGYQNGMSLVGHIGNILFGLPQQGSF